MIRFLFEVMVFQGLFLVGYDLFLRKETFFQWNRVYLLATAALSCILPLIRIDAFRQMAPEGLIGSAAPVYRLDAIILTPGAEEGLGFTLPWISLVYGLGCGLACLLFLRKLWQIRGLIIRGKLRRFPGYTRVLIPDSTAAFSFFRNIFIGASLTKSFRREVVAHELVHVRQGHSWDLMVFELLRLILWFNPLVYLMQHRVAELHEFIADRHIPPERKRMQYDFLLSSAFGLSGSFLNHYSKHSLIKKRIVMLQKTPTPESRKWKYALLIPILCLMLAYTSCQEESQSPETESMQVEDITNLSPEEEQKVYSRLSTLAESHAQWTFNVTDGQTSLLFREGEKGSYITGPDNEMIQARMEIIGPLAEGTTGETLFTSMHHAFGLVETPPTFPACEGMEDVRNCFNKQMQTHIRENFNYPQDAIAKGLQGRVLTFFTIDEEGRVSNIKTRGPDILMEKEAERIMKLLPLMKPGKQNGEVVKVDYSIPITFKLKA